MDQDTEQEYVPIEPDHRMEYVVREGWVPLPDDNAVEPEMIEDD